MKGVELAELVHGGVAVVVAVADVELRPEIGRGWGPLVEDDGSRMTVCVSAESGSSLEALLVPGAALAVTCSRPSTYRSVQLKGPVQRVAAPASGQLERVAEHLSAFSAEVATLGLTDARRMLQSALIAVTFEVQERYDQTPGPNAGAAV